MEDDMETNSVDHNIKYLEVSLKIINLQKPDQADTIHLFYNSDLRSQNNSSKFRLPRIELKKFYQEMKNWFWSKNVF